MNESFSKREQLARDILLAYLAAQLGEPVFVSVDAISDMQLQLAKDAVKQADILLEQLSLQVEKLK